MLSQFSTDAWILCEEEKSKMLILVLVTILATLLVTVSRCSGLSCYWNDEHCSVHCSQLVTSMDQSSVPGLIRHLHQCY